jgi:hypothetical protein
VRRQSCQPPTFPLTPGGSMSATCVESFPSQQLGARASVRRRFVPPSLPEPVSQSQNQRWREGPRCSALPVAPERRDGVVHASVGRVPCRCHKCSARAGRWRRPHAHAHVRVRRDKAVGDPFADLVCSRGSLSRNKVAFGEPVFAPDTIASLMLAPCSASSMLFATLRPGRGPGLRALTTPVRGTCLAITRWRFE